MTNMTNPAEELYQIFNEWREESKQRLSGNREKRIFESRKLGHSQKTSLDAWEKQRYAAQCIQGIHRIIKEMELSGDDVSAELAFFEDWTKAVFAYPGGFEKQGSGISNEAFATLKMFRNSVKNFIPDLNADVISELTELLQNEPDLTMPEGSFPAELYDYFTRVRGHLKYCLDNYSTLSYFDLRDAAEHYRAAVIMMSNGNLAGNAKSWKSYASKFFELRILKNFSQNFQNEFSKQLSSGSLRMISEGVQNAIESGTGS